MNSIAKSPALFAALLAGTLVLSGCAGEPAPPPEPPLAGASIGGEFELLNTAGETVRFSDFEGQYRIVYFGYAFCPDVCPTDVQRTIQGLDQFAKDQPQLAKRIQPIFISVDPERDSPDVIDEFTGAFSDDLIGLTGSEAQLKEAAQTFGVYFRKLEPSPEGTYLVDHARTVYLFGPGGEPIALLPADEGADAVTRELSKWVV